MQSEQPRRGSNDWDESASFLISAFPRRSASSVGSMADVTAREALSQAIRYWEPRRLLYNAVLLGEVVAIFALNLPGSRSRLNVDVVLLLFVLAVLSNVAYCASYLVDVAAQLSVFRATWLRFRWALFLVGVAFAGALTYFFAFGLFFPHES
jgi:hypothetical protein